MSKKEQIIMENLVKGDVDTGIELSIFHDGTYVQVEHPKDGL
jgi:hypothetical protein